MPPILVAPLMLSLLVGVTLGLAAWGLVRGHDREAGIVGFQKSDRLLIGLLALAAFAIGAFVTYVLLIVAVW
jgi:hypothetical protein